MGPVESFRTWSSGTLNRRFYGTFWIFTEIFRRPFFNNNNLGFPGCQRIFFLLFAAKIERSSRWRLPRFEALAHVLPHFDALTHAVIRVSSSFIFQTFAEVCFSVFVNRSSFKSVLNLRKAYIFKSLLKVYYRSVFNESSKAFIFQKCAENLHPDKSHSWSYYGSWPWVKLYFGLSLHIFLWKMCATLVHASNRVV